MFAGAASHFPLTEDREVASPLPLRSRAGGSAAGLEPRGGVPRVGRWRAAPRPLRRPRLRRRSAGAATAAIALHGESLDPARRQRAEGRAARGEGRARQGDRDLHGWRRRPDAEAMREVATARELGIAVFVIGVGTKAKGGLDLRHRSVHPASGPSARHILPERRDGDLDARRRGHAGARRPRAATTSASSSASETGEVDPTPIVTALHAVQSRARDEARGPDARTCSSRSCSPAFMLLVIEAAIGTRRRRRYPEER